MSNSVIVFDADSSGIVANSLPGSVVVIEGQATTLVQSDGPTNLAVITSGNPGSAGLAGLGLPTFVHGGLLEVILTGKGKIYNDLGRILTLGILRASVEGPCVGAPIIVDLTLDGVPLGLPLVLVQGAFTVTLDAGVPWPMGAALGVQVQQVGSLFAGDTLIVSAAAR